jgi:4-hydroxy-tetrahydrodipicolinate reductase
MKTRLIISGVFGRMGTVLQQLCDDHPTAEIVAGVDVSPNRSGIPFPVYADISRCIMPADAIIVVLPPDAEDAILATFAYAVKTATPVVICTTGLTACCQQALHDSSDKVPVLHAPNMSLGINLLRSIVAKAAKLLHSEGFDIEITERHHGGKLDAPSGTAMLLADAANQALGGDMQIRTARCGNAKRAHDEIGVHAIRGGNIVGQHSVIFAGKDEIVEISHAATSRDVFAIGALKAAKYLAGMAAGHFTMQDVVDEY